MIFGDQTPIKWLPLWFADTWRALLIVILIFLIIAICWEFVSEKGFLKNESQSFKILWLVVLLYTIRSAIIAIENFGESLNYENTPITTITVFLSLMFFIQVYRDKKIFNDGKEGTSPSIKRKR